MPRFRAFRFWLPVAILVLTAMGACFTADREPEEEPGPSDDDDDDDGDADDDVDDDDVDDDETDDDADDDADDDSDDDTTVEVSCDDIMSTVYDACKDAFAEKGTGDRLSRADALAVCESGGDYWACVQGCLDAETGNCDDLIGCVNGDCVGSLRLDDVPE